MDARDGALALGSRERAADELPGGLALGSRDRGPPDADDDGLALGSRDRFIRWFNSNSSSVSWEFRLRSDLPSFSTTENLDF